MTKVNQYVCVCWGHNNRIVCPIEKATNCSVWVGRLTLHSHFLLWWQCCVFCASCYYCKQITVCPTLYDFNIEYKIFSEYKVILGNILQGSPALHEPLCHPDHSHIFSGICLATVNTETTLYSLISLTSIQRLDTNPHLLILSPQDMPKGHHSQTSHGHRSLCLWRSHNCMCKFSTHREQACTWGYTRLCETLCSVRAFYWDGVYKDPIFRHFSSQDLFLSL